MAAEGNASTSTSTAPQKEATDTTLQLIQNIIAEKNYNLKLVPKDFACKECNVLAKEKEDLEAQLDRMKSEATLTKDLIVDIIRVVNFRQDPPGPFSVISLEFQEKLKVYLNEIMTDYSELQEFVKRPLVLEDLLKRPVFPLTPLPSPSEPLETDTLIGTGGTSPPSSSAENQPISSPPPPRSNPSANDMAVAGSSGSCFSKSANLNATRISPDITEAPNPVCRTSKRLTSTSQLSASTSTKTVAPPPPREKTLQSSINEPTALRKSSRPPTKIIRLVKNSSDCPKEKGKEDRSQNKISNSGEESTTPPPPPATKGSSLAPPPSLLRFTGHDFDIPVRHRPRTLESSDDESSYEMDVTEPLPPVLDENQPRNSNGNSSRQGEDGGDSQQNWKLARCGYCGFKPENIEQLQSHVEEEHKYIINDIKVVCRRCNSKFTAGSFPKHACRD